MIINRWLKWVLEEKSLGSLGVASKSFLVVKTSRGLAMKTLVSNSNPFAPNLLTFLALEFLLHTGNLH